MKKNIKGKSEKIFLIAVFTFFMSPVCFSQGDLESKTGFTEKDMFPSLVKDIKILNVKSLTAVDERNNKNESLNRFDYSLIALRGDTIKGTLEEKIVKSNSDPANKNDQIKSIDSTKYSMFGDLLDDDPEYNKKEPLWIPLIEVPAFNVGLWAVNRYISNADFARIGPESWAHNLETGWEWDFDRFGMNFLAHPYSGGIQFTSARSNGYNFWESLPFAFGGSLMWEYFGENTLPAYNDIVNTPVSGAFYGEILYRLGSNVLDDRTTGLERILREFAAAALSPTCFFNRLVQGKLSRVTPVEVYQKEPLNVELSLGVRKLNHGSSFWTGEQNPNLSAQFDYGYPFEKRSWKPYDLFSIRASINLDVGRKIIENISGYGILTGKTVQKGELEILLGIFQHYNYFDNKTFELGALAFGGGILTKYTVSKGTFVFTNFHLGIVPLAGNSTRFGPDTSQIRDYNYGGGANLKLESGIDLGWANFQFIGYYFWVHTYVGNTGNNFIGIIRPRLTIKIYDRLHIGFEQLVYYSDRYSPTLGNFHQVRTEQRIYLMLNVGNFKL